MTSHDRLAVYCAPCRHRHRPCAGECARDAPDAAGRTIRQRAEAEDCPVFHAPPAPIPLTIARAVCGAAGIVKAIVRIDRPPPDVIDARAAACMACDRRVLSAAGALARCQICGCAVWAKIRNASQSCPLNPPKWGPGPRKT